MNRDRLPRTRKVDPLAEALTTASGARRRIATPAAEREGPVAELARRLDDRGGATGRVTAARVDDLVRSFERLEAKLNAILLAVMATCVSTLLGLLVSALRARGALP